MTSKTINGLLLFGGGVITGVGLTLVIDKAPENVPPPVAPVAQVVAAAVPAAVPAASPVAAPSGETPPAPPAVNPSPAAPVAAAPAPAPAPAATQCPPLPAAAPAARVPEGKPPALTAEAPKVGRVLANYKGIIAALPTNWIAQEPENSMRLAQFKVPGAKGAEDGEVVVFYFPPGNGGTPDMNIARWGSQFSKPGGGPVVPKVSRAESNSMPVTRAEFEGSYSRGVGVGADASAKPDQVLLAAIINPPNNANLTFHFFGPKATVAKHRAIFEETIKTLRPSGH